LTLVSCVPYNCGIRTAESSGRDCHATDAQAVSILPVVQNSTVLVIVCDWNI